MLLFALQILGIVGLIFGTVAFIRNRRDCRHYSEQRRAMWTGMLFGLLLAIGSFFVSYPLKETVRIIGFPFISAAFENRGDIWMDFVGPLTFPAMLANATFAFFLPQIFLRGVRRWRSRQAER